MMQSRVDSTRVVGEAIAAAASPPRVWLQASTATIYAHRFDAPNDERTGILGGDEPDAPDTWRFSIDVARAWERTLDEARTPRTRKVALRSAMIMSPDRGGIFDTLRALAAARPRRPGRGRAAVRLVDPRARLHARGRVARRARRDRRRGQPRRAEPAAQRRLHARAAPGLRRADRRCRRRGWMLEVGAFLMRTETELVLKSRRVVPGRLLEHGFAFEYPDWPAAARDLCAATRTPTPASRPAPAPGAAPRS